MRSKSVHKQEYHGYTIEIEQGKSGRYRYIIHGLYMSDMRFLIKDNCLQAAFRKIYDDESIRQEYEGQKEVNKTLDELEGLLSTIDHKIVSMRKRVKQLRKITYLLKEEE